MILRSGASGIGWAAKESKPYGQRALLNLLLGGGVSYVSFPLPKDLRKGATIFVAKLRFQQNGAWPVKARSLTKLRAATPWLISTLTWKLRPAVLGTPGTADVVTKTSGPDLTVWEWDVLADVNTWVNGGQRNYGWRISTDDAASTHYLRGFLASTGKPTLELEWGYKPGAPTDLHPSAGAVSVAQPVLRFSAGDIIALHVQIDPAGNATAPAWDSGWVTTTEEQLRLAETTYPGLALGASTKWRAQVRGAGNLESDWSQWATFPRTAKEVLGVVSPTTRVLESTPPIVWTMPNMVEFAITVARADDPTRLLYNTRVVAGTDPEHTPTKPVFTDAGVDYLLTVRGWDAVPREYTYGDPRSSDATVVVRREFVTTQPGVDFIEVEQRSGAPWVDVVWGRSVMPDGWAVHRNDVELATFDSADDVLVEGSSTVYRWRDWTAKPTEKYDYFVGPVVNNEVTELGPRASITPRISGVWLADPESGTDVLITGREEVAAAYGEDADTYAGIGATTLVRVVYSLRGLEGDVTGEVTDVAQYERVGAEERDKLFAFKGRPMLPLRLAWADTNIPVKLSNVQPIPRRVGTSIHGVTRAVSFHFEQDGELPFTPEL